MSDTMYMCRTFLFKEGFMNLFFGGMAVGFVMFAAMAMVVIFNRMQQEITLLRNSSESMHKALQMMFMKVTKIEKTTLTTMNGIETFVDGLRQATEMMFTRPPHESPENFDDLKKSFEEGIQRFEKEMNDDDEDDSKEDWQK